MACNGHEYCSRNTFCASQPRLMVLQGFLQDTSLHGLKYSTNARSNKYEKAFWILAFVTGFSLSVYLVTKIYSSWQDKPIITTVETNNEPIENIVFPAVTICPNQQVLAKYFDVLRNSFHDLPVEKLFFMYAFQLVLSSDENDSGFGTFHDAEFATLASYFDNSTIDFNHAMKRVAPKCDDIVLNCIWKGQPGCQVNMTTALTPMGYCCTFNFHNVHSLEKTSYRTAYSGKGFGLQLVLLAKVNDTMNRTFGHQICIHDHNTFPYRPSLELQVQSNDVINVAVSPVLVKSDAEVRSVPPDKRDCNFPDEFELSLNFSKTYHNCIADCFSKHQLRQCRCVQGYMQPFLANATACGIRESSCLRKVLRKVQENLTRMCPCRPPCEEVVYNSEISVRNMTFPDILLPVEEYNRTKLREYKKSCENYSVVRVFFKESRFTKFQRSLRYQWEDFIAAAGGLLGVGFGFSLLSVAEIIYFFGYKCWKPDRQSTSPVLPFHQDLVSTLPSCNHQRFVSHTCLAPISALHPPDPCHTWALVKFTPNSNPSDDEL